MQTQFEILKNLQELTNCHSSALIDLVEEFKKNFPNEKNIQALLRKHLSSNEEFNSEILLKELCSLNTK